MSVKPALLILCSMLVILSVILAQVAAQDYEVFDIDCSLGENSISDEEYLQASLRKPLDFKGVPLFADDRKKDPLTDRECSIVPDELDPQGLTFSLKISNLKECGVILKNDFISVRVWFPRLSGVVMMSDQEVIIMCKPPQPTVTLNKAAEYAGQIPPTARVSGVVQESPGNLEYEVALFRETDPEDNDLISNEIPVEQAVPIGTKLQLRASINTNSSWKYVKLLEVTLSPSSEDSFARGHIRLIQDGCRQEEFYSIIPRQPYHPTSEASGEVRLEFEAVLLDVQGEAKRINQLWIHARIKACVSEQDCEPEFCLDVFQPKGAGRKRRDLLTKDGVTRFFDGSPTGQAFLVKNPEELVKRESNRRIFTQSESKAKSTSVGDNVGVTVVLPDDYYQDLKGDKRGSSLSSVEKTSAPSSGDCRTITIVSVSLACALIIASLLLFYLSMRLFRVSKMYKRQKLDEVVREHRLKYGMQQHRVGHGSPGLGVHHLT